MATHQQEAHPSWLRRTASQLGRDYAYVVPGMFISVFAFAVLLTLFTLGVGTVIIWVGAIILPFTLAIAGAFADLSRVRLRMLGIDFAPVQYQPRQRGVLGTMKTLSDPRRWLDLVFEGLIAFPMRLFTFLFAVTWSAIALGGLTFWIWGATLPRGTSLIELILDAMFGGAIPASITGSFWVDAVFNLVLGIIAIVTLPWVMRGLALLDASVTKAALLGGSSGVSNRPGPPRQDAPGSGAAAQPRPRIRTEGTARGQSLSADGWAWIVAGAAAVALLAVTWPVLAAAYEWNVVVSMVLAVAQSAAVVLAVRWAVAAILLDLFTITGSILYVAAAGPLVDLPLPWPVTLLIAHSLIVLLVALRRPWPWSVIAWFGGLVPSGLLLAILDGTDLPGHVMANIIVAASVSGGVAVIGIVIRQLTQSRGALDTERRASAEQTAKRQELEERNRIAQELHDVVAHSMSVIAVQSTTAKYRIEGLDDRAVGEFASIADSSRRALTEMRGLLSLLRTDSDAPLAPQPELADLEALIESTRQSGARIDFTALDSQGEPAQLAAVAASVPSATGLTAYRIVQESLSNAVRHSPGADVHVSVRRETDALSIRVENGLASEALAASPSPGSGMGLVGLRGRAAAFGGQVTAGPTATGYLLTARLPLQ
ncbi:MAG: sensor histidine kinase [Agrococcus casei]|uniref:sensor histidine kinase n=1 Tax=Agrococcus casei TaxID=343512 RepID=UPI003F9D18DA